MQLALWTESACEQYGAFADVATLLRLAPSVTCAVIRDHGIANPSLESDLTALDTKVAEKLADLHASTNVETHTAVDEIDGTIAALLVQLDDADPLSAEHSRAVSLWCRRLARRLNLSEERCQFVARAGLLHDVGKARTPQEILLAPRGLTREEFATIQEHPTVGAAMVMEFDRLRPFAPVVGAHHERLDGNGYPSRLAARDISLEVRIVTVADAFNAMIGRRPYRPPMSPAFALEQLVRHSVSQFDSMVVEAMIDIIEHPDD